MTLVRSKQKVKANKVIVLKCTLQTLNVFVHTMIRRV